MSHLDRNITETVGKMSRRLRQAGEPSDGVWESVI